MLKRKRIKGLKGLKGLKVRMYFKVAQIQLWKVRFFILNSKSVKHRIHITLYNLSYYLKSSFLNLRSNQKWISDRCHL